ncbi:MAG: P1 family peptidase [Anaerolineae bacterium]|jgi:L-aminopeptidase/D-esterase-like protein|nr:P1 family peptidase [Anaerolineae bacterium]
MQNSILDVAGLKIGHAENYDALTGCTVILCDDNVVGGVDQRGGAPGTRETDLLSPMHSVQYVNAILLTGGSAFGLDAASGVMKFCEEQGKGFPIGGGVVPIVPGAVIFDLMMGDPNIRPDAAMGYQACLNAADSSPQGNVGAGLGATIGKFLGPQRMMKGGLGTASIEIVPGLVIGALFVVNALGSITDPANGELVAGTRSAEYNQPVDSLYLLKRMASQQMAQAPGGNTVIGVVATNAKFNKEQTNKLAQMGQDGIAMAVRPAHSMMDGDTVFALSTGKVEADFNLVSAFAAEVCARAIVNAVKHAKTLAGVPGYAGV